MSSNVSQKITAFNDEEHKTQNTTQNTHKNNIIIILLQTMATTSQNSGKSCTCSGSKSHHSLLPFCPFSLFIFASSAIAYTQYLIRRHLIKTTPKTLSNSSSTTEGNNDDDNRSNDRKQFQVVFILGGPGAGKGTQCTLLAERMSWTHLSAGDLLRAERKSGSDLADLINTKISNGQIVPSSITVTLLKTAMEKAYDADNTKTKFLIDGFPRSEENVSIWEQIMPVSVATLEFVLFLDCPEDVMTGRLLERSKTSGRNDDNLETIRKRFVLFRETSMPIVDMFEAKGMLKTVIADKSVDDVYKEVETLFKDHF